MAILEGVLFSQLKAENPKILIMPVLTTAGLKLGTPVVSSPYRSADMDWNGAGTT